GSVGRNRVVRVSSGVLARGAHGLGGPAWNGAITISGRGQRRISAGATSGRVCADAGTSQRRLVFVCGAAGNRAARANWRLGQKKLGEPAEVPHGSRGRRGAIAGVRIPPGTAGEKDCVLHGDPGRAYVF